MDIIAHPTSADFPAIKKGVTKCFYDSELYKNKFFVVCKLENQYFFFSNPMKSSKLKTLWEDAIMIGYNNRSYDSRMVGEFFECAEAFKDKTNKTELLLQRLHGKNKAIISEQNRMAKNGFANRQKDNHYDAKIGCGKIDRSLKEWELLLGMSVEESPIPFDADLDEKNIMDAIEYCAHDIDATELLFSKKCIDNFNAIRILCELAGQNVNYGKTIGSVTVDLLCAKAGKIKKGLGNKTQFDYSDIMNRLRKSGYLDMDNVEQVLDSILRYEEAGIPEVKNAYLGHIEIGGMLVEIGAGGAHWCSSQKLWIDVDDSDVASMYPNIMLAYKIIDRTLGEIGNQAFADMIKTRLKNKKTNPDLANALKIAINSVYGKMSGDGGLNDHSGRLAVCIIGQFVICDLVARYMKNIPECKIAQINTDGVIYKFDKKKHKHIADSQMKEWSELFSMDLETVPIEFLYQHNINNYVAKTIDGGKEKMKYKGSFFQSSNGTKEYIYKALIHYAVNGEKPDIREFPKTDFIEIVKSRKVGGTNEKYEILVDGKYMPNKLVPYVKVKNGVPIAFRNPVDGKISGSIVSNKNDDLPYSETEENTPKTLPKSCQIIFKRDDALNVEPDYDALGKDVDEAIAALKAPMKEKEKIKWDMAMKKEENKKKLKDWEKNIANGTLPKGAANAKDFVETVTEAGLSKSKIDAWLKKRKNNAYADMEMC